MSKYSHVKFKKGDIVHISDVPPLIKGSPNPLYKRLGVVVNSQPNDVDVTIDGITDGYGIGFLPESLKKVNPNDLTNSIGVNGITLINNACEWLNDRNEGLNDDKPVSFLLNEYIAALLYGLD